MLHFTFQCVHSVTYHLNDMRRSHKVKITLNYLQTILLSNYLLEQKDTWHIL